MGVDNLRLRSAIAADGQLMEYQGRLMIRLHFYQGLATRRRFHSRRKYIYDH